MCVVSRKVSRRSIGAACRSVTTAPRLQDEMFEAMDYFAWEVLRKTVHRDLDSKLDSKLARVLEQVVLDSTVGMEARVEEKSQRRLRL